MVNLSDSSVSLCERQKKVGDAVFIPPSAEEDSHPCLQRLVAHVIHPEQYEEIPELRELDLAEPVIRLPGRLNQPFL